MALAGSRSEKAPLAVLHQMVLLVVQALSGGSVMSDEAASNGRSSVKERKRRRAALRARLQANIEARVGPGSKPSPASNATARQTAPSPAAVSPTVPVKKPTSKKLTPVTPTPKNTATPKSTGTSKTTTSKKQKSKKRTAAGRSRLANTMPPAPQRKRVNTEPPPIPAALPPTTRSGRPQFDKVLSRDHVALTPAKPAVREVPKAETAPVVTEVEPASPALPEPAVRVVRKSTITTHAKPAESRRAPKRKRGSDTAGSDQDELDTYDFGPPRVYPWRPLAMIGAPILVGLVILFVAIGGDDGPEATPS
ncbi:MAG: hypothetical protein ACI9MR_003787, partial [Myxococcota bacterium]